MHQDEKENAKEAFLNDIEVRQLNAVESLSFGGDYGDGYVENTYEYEYSGKRYKIRTTEHWDMGGDYHYVDVMEIEYI